MGSSIGKGLGLLLQVESPGTEVTKPLDVQRNHLLSFGNPPAEDVKEPKEEKERERKRRKGLLILKNALTPALERKTSPMGKF
jgi:hypothetical protein